MSLKHSDYTVAWVAALPTDLEVAVALLDQKHDDLHVSLRDTNIYRYGKTGSHNVVIISHIDERNGMKPPSYVAADMLQEFPNIRFGMSVGVGGGVPGSLDVRLGDIAVGTPKDSHNGVVQYDKDFVRKGTLNKSPSLLRSAIIKMRALAAKDGYRFLQHYSRMLELNPKMRPRFERPNEDRLYAAKYVHQGRGTNCEECSSSHLVVRSQREGIAPQVFNGLIGSTDRPLRDARLRDELYKRDDVICFKTDDSGMTDDVACIFIQGISDYADTHDNETWKPYSSAIAGAFAKELLLIIPPLSLA